MNFKNIALGACLLLVATAGHAANDKVDERIKALFATAQPLMVGHPGYKNPIMVEEEEIELLLNNLDKIDKSLDDINYGAKLMEQDKEQYKAAFMIVTTILIVKSWYDYRGRSDIDLFCKNIRSLIS